MLLVDSVFICLMQQGDSWPEFLYFVGFVGTLAAELLLAAEFWWLSPRAGGDGTRQEGRGRDWTADPPILRKPAPSFFTCSPVSHQPPRSDPLWPAPGAAGPLQPLLALLACTCGPPRLQSGWCSYYPAVLYFMNRKEAAAGRTDAESLQECQLPADHQYFCHLIISISVTWS